MRAKSNANGAISDDFFVGYFLSERILAQLFKAGHCLFPLDLSGECLAFGNGRRNELE